MHNQWVSLAAAGLQTSQDARFYAASSRFDDFSNQGKTLVIQFTVKHEQEIDCGGGYIKLFPSDLNQEDMNGDSTYNIMFGERGWFLMYFLDVFLSHLKDVWL